MPHRRLVSIYTSHHNVELTFLFLIELENMKQKKYTKLLI